MANKNKGKQKKKRISLSSIFRFSGLILFIYALFRLLQFVLVGSLSGIIVAAVYMKDQMGNPEVFNMLPAIFNSLTLTLLLLLLAGMCYVIYWIMESTKKRR